MRNVKCIFFILFLGVSNLASAAETVLRTDFEISLGEDDSISVARYPAQGNRLLLMISGHRGFFEGDYDLARDLTRHEVEVWAPDLLAARFLTPEMSSLAKIPMPDITAMLDAAIATGKWVFLFTRGRGAAVTLRGLEFWLAHGGDAAKLGGMVLTHPFLFSRTPDPGRDAAYLPDVREQFLPIALVEPAFSPHHPTLDSLIAELESGGSTVITRRLPGVAPGFWIRRNSSSRDDEAASQFPELIAGLLPELEKAKRPPRPARFDIPDVPVASASQHGLKTYTGDPSPPPLALPDLQGQIQRQEFGGEVLLINFWATWCPPCIKEMPSMQRLKERLRGRPFRIIAVNVGEEPPEAVRAFLDKTGQLDFTFLTDDGGVATTSWKIFAYPTSFLVDATGVIRFAATGLVDWTDPGVIQIVESLLPASP